MVDNTVVEPALPNGVQGEAAPNGKATAPDSTETTPATPNGNTKAADSKESKPRAPRPKRPNYAQLHSKPLPLETTPLPAFIPHNPLSIVRIAIALLSHSLFPPKSKHTIHKAYFSSETQSVHVTDPASIRALWEQGFFGTGSLSRTEPRWLDQEKRKRGLIAAQTSEEVTRQRRAERRQFKLERARLEREAIEQQRLIEEGKALANGHGHERSTIENGSVDAPLEPNSLGPNAATATSDANTVVATLTIEADLVANGAPPRAKIDGDTNEIVADIVDQEHLQLSLEEAFFLTYALDALQIEGEHVSLNTSYLFRLYSLYSAFPILEHAKEHLDKIWSYQQNSDCCGQVFTGSLDFSGVSSIAPDNSFVVKYAVYHHFRSLGWVVRTGIKFGTDYLLYNRGPAFSHAEFGVMVVPSYSHPYWSETPERKEECKKKEQRDWWWLHRVNRVQAQVHKTLMLVYVDIPPPWDENYLEVGQKSGFKVDVGSVLTRYKVREFVLGRWTPNRHRG